MSVTEIPTVGKAKVYDDKGRTMIPKDVRDEMGIEYGDEVVFVIQDGETKIYKADDIN